MSPVFVVPIELCSRIAAAVSWKTFPEQIQFHALENTTGVSKYAEVDSPFTPWIRISLQHCTVIV